MQDGEVTSRFVVKLAVHSTESISITPDLLAKLITGYDNHKLLYYCGEVDYGNCLVNEKFERIAKVIPINNINNREYKSFLSYRVDPYHWQGIDKLNNYIKNLVYTSRQIKLKDLDKVDINITDKEIIKKIINYCQNNNMVLIGNYLTCCEYLYNKLKKEINSYNQEHLPQQTNLKPLVIYNYDFSELN